VRFALSIAVFVALGALAACTETPSYFPPCVNPDMPCPADDGGDAGDAGDAAFTLDAGDAADADDAALGAADADEGQ
jgi:hypothetical protein